MDLFVSWTTLWDEEDPKIAVLADDAEALRRKNQSVEAARRIIESWLLRIGGQTIDFSGASGHCQVPADELSDLERIRAQFSQTLGNVRVAMGVGIKLSEADLALKTAVKQGGDKIVLFTPEAAADTAAESAQAMNKAVPAMNGGQGGFSGATQAAAPGVAKPLAEGSEHSEAEAEASLLDNATPPAELTHAAADEEEEFGRHADQADKDEQSQHDASAKQGADGDLKKEVLKVLQGLKSQSQTLGQIAATEPKLFAVIQESIKAMLLLAKRLCGTPEAGAGQPVAKSEGVTIVMVQPRSEETSHKEASAMPVPAPEAQWGYHIVSEWDNLDDIARVGLRPRPEEGTATLHFTTDFESIREREGDILRFPVPVENSPNPYRPDKPSERITTSTIPPESLQLCSQWRKLEMQKTEKEWFMVTMDPALKADHFFRHPAFLGKNGQVVTTPGFHDIDQLPAGFEIDKEGYVSGDGRFYDRTEAEEISRPLEPVKKAESNTYDSVGRRKSAAQIQAEYIASPEHQRERWLNSRQGFAKSQSKEPAGKPLRVQHFSITPGLKHLDPKFQGTGAVGPEKNRGGRIPRTYFYTHPGTPESHVASGAHQYHGILPANTRLYDMGKDHLGLLGSKMVQTKYGQMHRPVDLTQVEKKIAKLGYHGYHNYGVKDAIAYFHKLPVQQAEGEESISKKLPLPENAPKHTHHEYPVGAVKDSSPQGGRDVGKVKVQTENGTKWRQVRAGMVMAQDGAAASSRNPGAK